MRAGLLVALSGLLLVGCGAEELASVARPIYNGVEDPGHPAVGPLKNIFCTATLVGPRSVLTAAHCLQETSPYSIELGGKLYGAAKVIPHPDWRTEDGAVPELHQTDWKYSVNDLGLLLLEEPVVGIEPVRLARQTPTVGQAVTLIGFGVTADGSSGARRKADNVVGAVASGMVFFGTIAGLGGSDGLTCTGDSGGPAMVVEQGEERVLSVHSMAICGKYSQGTRVTPYLDWLEVQSGGDLVAEVQPIAARLVVAPASPAAPATPADPAGPPAAAAAGCSVGASEVGAPSGTLLGLLVVALSARPRSGRRSGSRTSPRRPSPRRS